MAADSHHQRRVDRIDGRRDRSRSRDGHGHVRNYSRDDSNMERYDRDYRDRRDMHTDKENRGRDSRDVYTDRDSNANRGSDSRGGGKGFGKGGKGSRHSKVPLTNKLDFSVERVKDDPRVVDGSYKLATVTG